jgi:flagellar biosynthesis protein FliP
MTTFLQALVSILRAAWKIIAPIVAQQIITFINNKCNQKAAKDAVVAVMKDGLKDNEAFDKAADILKKSMLDSGKQVSQILIDTLIQNAYFEVKCGSMTKEEVDKLVIDVK